MKNIILFYESENKKSPVEDFIKSLPTKHRAKVYWEIAQKRMIDVKRRIKNEKLGRNKRRTS